MQDAAPADPEDFPEPSGITMATIDPESGGLATSACPKPVALPFLDGSQPTQMCPIHGGIFASAPGPAPIPGMPGAMPSPGGFATPQPVAGASPASSDVFSALGKFIGGLFSH
jgi:penicillin-binding protein 1B